MATNSLNNNVHLNEVIVAMVPFPDFSHLNQLFVLARFIASHNIPIHFLCLADRNQDLKLRVQGGLGSSNIHFHDLSVPIEESEDADDGLHPIVIFLRKLVEPIQRTCIDLAANAKRLVIIHDSIMRDHIRDVHSLISKVESYMFHSISAFARYSLLRQSIDHLVDDDDHENMIQQMHDEFPLLKSYSGLNAAAFVKKEHEWNLNSGEIINSCREIEGKYIDLLARTKDKKQWWAIGPLHMLLLESHDSRKRTRHECLEFLDKQDVNSVIFVSFGTTTTFSQEQVNEIALGLERSNHKFIWVLREADKKMEIEKFEEEDGKIELQNGFEERVSGRGIVVRNWVPQLEILGHSSPGGFLSHSGWNSCLESISMGVPLAAWPTNHDQPFNAIFITNLLKIGTSVRSWARREELVTASTIEKAVKTLMGTTEGEEMRQRAAELSKKIKSSISRGGLARKEMESFISRIFE
ncbi:zeatin O-glucosyltransferase-like [Lycium ferocissimum]|uniref:zeatin O-glucosyltransferase-like n=1 Tax=Lycium ferocissimum TaxID=112874 RepID=UPI0028157C51|nr:zeatin O-glucosyltransferase-like [Lycium ferocissimum]